ncbi:MAG: ATP-binding protein, partial [Desulfurococcales archaeon]|nr:ATP-binding protein [Desulfurococcales archaeon]
MKRVKLKFSGDIEVEFTDRDRAVAQVSEIAERGTYPVYVIYGPEGCGKTALFRQAREILEDEYGYHVIHANPLAESREEALAYTPSIRDLVREALKLFPEPYSRVADVAINAASLVMKRLRRPRVAVLMDDLFQAVGVDRAEAYTKTLLNLIEYPPGDYDRIVVLVASSEGVTRERVGRHDWATMMLLWNMPREG